MNLSQQVAKHLRDVHLGGNWTAVNFKDTLKDVSWQQAITKVHHLNTIATLVYHSTYYIGIALKVLRGGPLEGKDEDSFKLPPIQSQRDWENLVERVWSEVEVFAKEVETLPESKLGDLFAGEKYGSYFRNIEGIVEHAHYHLGQIMLIKKILNVPSHLQTETS